MDECPFSLSPRKLKVDIIHQSLIEVFGNKEEFENLRKDLELKSSQISNLKSQIEQHKGIIQDRKPDENNFMNISTTFDQSLRKTTPNAVNMPLHFIPGGNEHFLPQASGNADSMVRQFHHQVDDLQRKLKITTEMCAEQDARYQKSYKEMEFKLKRAINSRDELIRLRQAESNNQQKLINHLQFALDNCDRQKNEAIKDNTELTKSMEALNVKLNKVTESQVLYAENLKKTVEIVTPELKKLLSHDLIDVTIDNFSKYIEKFISLTNKEKETLKATVKTANDKIQESVSSVNVNFIQEKQSMEIKLKDAENKYLLDMNAKNNEIKDLKDEVNKLRISLERKVGTHESDLEIMKETMNKDKENLLNDLHKAIQNVDQHQEKIMSLENQLTKCVEEKNNVTNEYQSVQKSLVKITDEVKLSKETILNLENKNKELNVDVHDLQNTLHSLKSTMEIEKVRLQTELNRRNEDCETLIKKEKELYEKLSTLSLNTENKVRTEEKQKYENELTEINNVIENYKTVLDNAKDDIDDKQTLIEEANLKLGESCASLKVLKQENDSLKSDVCRLQGIVKEKDASMVSMLLSVDDVKKKLLNYEKNVQELSAKLKDCDSLILNLEKEKNEMQQSVEKSNFKADFMQKEWDNVMNGLNEKNEEIKSLQKEKKIISRKLKEKLEILNSKQAELKELNHSCNEIKGNYYELENNYNELLEQFQRIEKQNEILIDEKNALELVIDDQEVGKKKEMMRLLEKLKVSQGDLHLLKKLMDNQQMSDGKAVKVASATQKVVTKQRAEIDNLKTKIQWMKEALDVSERTRQEAQDETTAKDDVIENLKEKLKQVAKTNENLSLHLAQSQQEGQRLHGVLEKAAIKYTDVYSLLEKQENLLKRERESQIADKKDTRRKNSPDYIEKDNKLFNQTVDIGEDLRSLLKDVKKLLSSTLKQSNSAQGRHDTRVKTPDGNPQNLMTERVNNNTEYENFELPSSGENTLKLDLYLQQHSFEAINKNTLGLKNKTNKKLLVMDFPVVRPFLASSPKSPNSLSSTSTVEAQFSLGSSSFSMMSLNSLASDVTSQDDEQTHLKKEDTDIGANPMQRLQDKLSNLQNMGATLTNNNQELANMMKKHSKKIRNLKVATQTDT